jgi:hypothetical protein
VCKNCQRQGDICDYSIRLNWDARSRTKSEVWSTNAQSLPNTPSSIVFPSPEIFSGPSTPIQTPSSFNSGAKKDAARHARSRSNLSTPSRDVWRVETDYKAIVGSDSPGLVALDNAPQNGTQLGSGIIANHRRALAQDQRPRHLSPSWAAAPMPVAGASMGNDAFITESDTSVPLFPTAPQSDPASTISQSVTSSVDHILSADRSKRLRLSGPSDMSPIPLVSYEAPLDSAVPLSPSQLSKSPSFAAMPLSIPAGLGSSVAPSEEQTGLFTNFGSLQTSHLLNDSSRRVSVPVSLLIDKGSRSQLDNMDKPFDRKIEFKPDACKSFGYDRGWPDQDIPRHNDNEALVASPDISHAGNAVSFDPVTIDFDDYYAKPIRIDIPVALLPLPSQLASNPMNLLYFHHFLNHTARILTPHDCPANPYRTVLPRSMSTF